MSANPSARTGAENLQFDRAVDPAPGADAGAPVCSMCSSAIRMYYYDVDGATVCSSCKQGVERAAGGKAGGGMMKALLFGLGAAAVGAFIYYAVMEYMNLEIGIVAILIGFMVGHAIRNAAPAGGRRYQLLAAGLTYLAVAMAYAPFSVRGMFEARDEAIAADSAVVDSAGTATASDVAASASDDASAGGDASDASVGAETSGPPAAVAIVLGVGAALLFVLALPVMVVFGTMPSGLISAAIIGFGIHQAWTMTRALQLSITGPFKVGSQPPSAAA
jgi:hypothetical protein